VQPRRGMSATKPPDTKAAMTRAALATLRGDPDAVALARAALDFMQQHDEAAQPCVDHHQEKLHE
jgi:hypothetical protein